jgi:hypothetical protein
MKVPGQLFLIAQSTRGHTSLRGNNFAGALHASDEKKIVMKDFAISQYLSFASSIVLATAIEPKPIAHHKP